MIILWRADIPTFFEIIFLAIVQPDGKRPKRMPFHKFLNFLNFHRKKHTFHRNFRKPKPFWLLTPRSFILFPMFELIAPQLTTAAEKLTHLRRFL